MSKKWLYSVGAGALLMASEALGVTVHDVLSNGFWSAEQRGTYNYLSSVTVTRPAKIKKQKSFVDEAGVEHNSKVYVIKPYPYPQIKWKQKVWYNGEKNGEISTAAYEISKLNAKRPEYKEVTDTIITNKKELSQGAMVGSSYTEQSDYTAKICKGAAPISPYVEWDDWFPNSMKKDGRSFYGTEDTSVTNIIDDNNAFITRTIKQTGYIHKYNEYLVDEPASLLRVYNTSITTDENHVYVDQYISETANYQFDVSKDTEIHYTATSEKGRWKTMTETSTYTYRSEASDWYKDYLKSGTTSVHNEPAPEYGVRPGVAVDEHTQGMLDELNRPTAVRVVVSGQEKRPISKVKRSVREQE